MPSTRPRKVLIFAGDQWRGECLSAVGHPLVKTPSLDALAEAVTAIRALQDRHAAHPIHAALPAFPGKAHPPAPPRNIRPP